MSKSEQRYVNVCLVFGYLITNMIHSLVDSEMEDSEPQEIEKESKRQHEFVDSSSQVMMLQSYVLQFLCVQKVLKDAAAQNSMKKI